MKTLLRAVLLLMAGALPVSAQSIAGDWQGTLKVGQVELRLLVHITQSGAGLGATVDSIDQGVKDIPVNTVTFADGKLKFQSDAIGGSYEGTADAALATIHGAWSQLGMSAPLDLSRSTAAPPHARVVKGSDIDGDWAGTLLGMLRVVVHITTYVDGMAATFDSPDQNTFGLPVTSVSRVGLTLKFEMKQIGGEFSGTFTGDLSAVNGTWKQLGNEVPLDLTRKKK